jgi:5'-nucleotidase / UDP-sugar diphosphatase
MRRKSFASLAVVITLSVFLLAATTVWAQPRSLIILSTSDLQGQLEPVITKQGVGDGNATLEMGGFARMASVIKNIKKDYPGKVLTVVTGDDLMNKYFINFHGAPICEAMTAMGVDAGTLGNHEFDLGPSVLAEGLAACRFPVVESNLSAKAGSPLASRFVPSLVLERDGLRIGLLGLMTPELPYISKAGPDIEISPDLLATARETVKQLKEKDKVDLVVALTHIGLEEDQKLAAQIEDLDVICGSHSHDVLYQGQEAVIRHPSGRMTVIVQSGTRGEYLGQLKLEVDGGRIGSYSWDPILIGAQTPADAQVDALIASYRGKLPAKTVITTAAVPLDCRSETLRTQEVPVGNLVCDIMRAYFKVDVALQNGGSIRGDRILPAGPLSSEDVDTMFPFDNSVVVAKVTGKVLKDVLEYGVSRFPEKFGGFPQVSGLRLLVNPSGTPLKLAFDAGNQPIDIAQPGTRIAKVEVLAKDGSYQPLEPEKEYSVAINSFMAGGGDGYIMFKQSGALTFTYVSLKSVIESALKGVPQISAALEDRIQFAQ